MHPTIDLFGFTIDSYNLMMILGFIISLLVVLLKNKFNKDNKVNWKDICFLAVFVLFGALLGARVLYFITRIGDIKEFDDVIRFLITEGGLVFYGGVIGGVGFGILYLKIYKLDVKQFARLAIPVIPLGHALGRIGCYLAGCCYGRLTSSEHGVHFVSLLEGEYALPVQLYEAIFLLVLFVVLFVIEQTVKIKKDFFVCGLYFTLYAIWRFIIEFYRGDEIRGIALLSTSQWISIAMFAVGLYVIVSDLKTLKLFNVKKDN